MNKLSDGFRALYAGDNLLRITRVRYIPRWMVLFFDLGFVFFSVLISYYFLLKLNVKLNFQNLLPLKIFIVLCINLIFMFVFRTYAGIIRHSTFFDFFKILLSSGSSLITLSVLNYIFDLIQGRPLFLYPNIFLFFFVSVSFLFFFRMATKRFFNVLVDFSRAPSTLNVAVVGVEDVSVALARAIMHNPNYPYRLGGFVTNRTDSKRAILLGHNIYSKNHFFNNPKILRDFDAVLLIKEIMSKKELEEWMNLSLDSGLKVLKAPTIGKMRDQDLVGGIRNLQIEDLLNRRPIKIENEEVKKRHFGKNVLITGGAGSIGSEIVRQVAEFNPATIVVLDQAESPLYDLELELLEKFPAQKFKFILADISNSYRLEKIFEEYSFSMVYHAAAYKHVPLIEDNPHEAVFVNILGTKNVASLSKKYMNGHETGVQQLSASRNRHSECRI